MIYCPPFPMMVMAGLESSVFNLVLAFLAVFLLYKFLKSQHERRVCHLKSPQSSIPDSVQFHKGSRCLLTWE
jgi:hypothetical protein